MLIKSISFLKEDMTEVKDSIIDVFVRLENKEEYVVTLVTAKFLEYEMDDEKKNYWDGEPIIIVKELTKDIIVETIKEYAKERDGYKIKLYHYALDMDETIFNELKAKAEKELKEFNDEYEKEYGLDEDDEELYTYIYF